MSNRNYETSIIAELVLSPSTGQVSISQPLKEALKILQKNTKVKIQTHSMGTNIECHNIDDLFNAVKEVHNFLIKEGFPRVVTTLKIDERRDKPSRTMKDKIDAVS